jgi:hypothetical protein
MNSSVANSARSVVPSRTGVWCVWNPEIVRGLPAWPTTSTACTYKMSNYVPRSTIVGGTYLTNANGDRNTIELLIESDKEPWVHSRDQEVQHPMTLI